MNADNEDQRRGLEDASFRELRVLEEVGSLPELSQRHLSRKLGIALGVVNLIVRNLGKKGYIRATRAGLRRWVYNLTPAGVARKTQLTFGYIDRVLDHYARVRELLREDLGTLSLNADARMAIYGTTELAELMYLVVRDLGVSSIDIFDRVDRGKSFIGMPVQSLDSMVPDDYVKVMLAFSSNVETRRRELYERGVSPEQIVSPLQNSAPIAPATEEA